MERKLKQTSLDAYHAEQRKSNSEIILEYMAAYREEAFTYCELSRLTGINVNECQKRCSDMEKDGRLKVTGTKSIGKREKSLYQFYTHRAQYKKVSRFQLLKETIAMEDPISYHKIMDTFNKKEAKRKSA